MHILIMGKQGIGKSTLAKKIIEKLQIPTYGIITKKVIPHVYIGRLWHPLTDIVATFKESERITYPAIFEKYAPLCQESHSHQLMVIDELGFLESQSLLFQESILRRLDSKDPMLIIIKDMPIPFLEKIKSHPKTLLFEITLDNRDYLLEQILPHMQNF